MIESLGSKPWHARAWRETYSDLVRRYEEFGGLERYEAEQRAFYDCVNRVWQRVALPGELFTVTRRDRIVATLRGFGIGDPAAEANRNGT